MGFYQMDSHQLLRLQLKAVEVDSGQWVVFPTGFSYSLMMFDV